MWRSVSIIIALGPTLPSPGHLAIYSKLMKWTTPAPSIAMGHKIQSADATPPIILSRHPPAFARLSVMQPQSRAWRGDISKPLGEAGHNRFWTSSRAQARSGFPYVVGMQKKRSLTDSGD
jgi:hypothetical protein